MCPLQFWRTWTILILIFLSRLFSCVSCALWCARATPSNIALCRCDCWKNVFLYATLCRAQYARNAYSLMKAEMNDLNFDRMQTQHFLIRSLKEFRCHALVHSALFGGGVVPFNEFVWRNPLTLNDMLFFHRNISILQKNEFPGKAEQEWWNRKKSSLVISDAPWLQCSVAPKQRCVGFALSFRWKWFICRIQQKIKFKMTLRSRWDWVRFGSADE